MAFGCAHWTNAIVDFLFSIYVFACIIWTAIGLSHHTPDETKNTSDMPSNLFNWLAIWISISGLFMFVRFCVNNYLFMVSMPTCEIACINKTKISPHSEHWIIIIYAPLVMFMFSWIILYWIITDWIHDSNADESKYEDITIPIVVCAYICMGNAFFCAPWLGCCVRGDDTTNSSNNSASIHPDMNAHQV